MAVLSRQETETSLLLEPLDMSVLSTGSDAERRLFGDKFLTSLKDHGFAKIVNHPIPKEGVEDVFQQVYLFFSFPPRTFAKLSNELNSKY
jgi:isopenicillin N synthase-like dioxygenase